MLDRQFGINPPSLEDDEDDTPLYTSSREALGDITGKKAPSIQAPKNVPGGDPFAHLFGGQQAVPQPTGKPAAQAAPADPFAHLFGTVPTPSAPEKSKNIVERAAEVVDPAISRIFGDTSADESQIDKKGLARYKAEQKQKAEEVAGLRSIIGTDSERSDTRKLTESFVSGFLGSNAGTAEWIGQVTGSDTIKSVAGAGSKAAAAFAPEEQTFAQKVAAGFGSVAAFFVPGLGFVKAAKLLGAAKAAPAVGAGGSAVLESAAIAQETFEKAMSETGNVDVATEQAWKAAGINLPLSFVTNKIGLFGDKGGFVRRGAVAAGAESVQEGSQNVLTNVLGFKPAGEGVTEAAAIGGITGGGTKLTFDAVNKYFDNASPEERKDIVDKIIEGGKETRQSVFDSLMSNDATAKILREAGISTAEDPAFVKFGAALGRFDREFAELAADPEVGPKLIANGILDPNDPRVQRVADRVLNSKQEVKGINEILEITRSGVELSSDQKDQFNLLSAATNARELVDEITSNPELENVLKDMPGTAGFEGNRYNQIMGLWQKATIPKAAAPILVGSPTQTRTVSRETMQPIEKAPVAATGKESPGLVTSVEQINAELAKEEQRNQDAIRLAEARRQRAQQEVELSGIQPLDTQAGGRPGGIGAKEEFAYFNPVIKDGQMISGDRVEVVSGDQILDRITLGELQTTPERAIFLRFLDRPGQPEFPVPLSLAQKYVQFLNRPEAPRRAQDISEDMRRPQPGTMTDPDSTRGGPRVATDRITTDQSQQFVAADKAPPGTGVAPVRGGQTFEAEPVSEKLEAPGAARAKAVSRRLAAQGGAQVSPAPAASTVAPPSASQTASQAPVATTLAAPVPDTGTTVTPSLPESGMTMPNVGTAAAQQTVSPSDTKAAPKTTFEVTMTSAVTKPRTYTVDAGSAAEANRLARVMAVDMGQLPPSRSGRISFKAKEIPANPPGAEKAKQTSKRKTKKASQPEGTNNAAQERDKQQGGQRQRPRTGERVKEGGREDRQREAQEPQARAEDRRGGGAQESRQGTLDLRRSYPGENVKSIDDLNKAAQDVLDSEGNGEKFRAVKVPIGDIVGKVPGIGLIQATAKLFGKPVVFFKVVEGTDFFNGTVIRGSDTIFLNVNSTHPHIRIFGHELVHAIRTTDPATYEKLLTALKPLLLAKGFSEFSAKLMSEGVTTDHKILEEAVGDIVGDRFGETAFWEMLAENNPTGFRAVAKAVIDFIDNILGKLSGKYTLGSETLVKDLQSARREIARILGEAAPGTADGKGSGMDLARKSVRDTVSVMSLTDDKARETLGLDKKKNKVRQIGEALSNRTTNAGLAFDQDDTSDAAVTALGTALYKEVAYQLRTTSETGTGLGWYSNNYPKALRLLAKRFPELANNADARNIFTAIVAITSNGEKVSLNVSNAIKIYRDFRQGKTMLESGGSVGVRRGDALYSNLVELDELIADHGLSKLREYLTTETTVSRMNKLLRESGKKPDGSYKANTRVPTAAIHFGPKLGAFYANLSGSEGYLTMDLWWTRTINRMRGQLIPKATDSSIDTIRKIVGDMSLTKDQALDIAVDNAEIYDRNNFKTPLELFMGSKEPDNSADRAVYFEQARAQTGDAFEEMLREHRLHKSSNTIYKNEFLMLEEAPFNASDREFMYKIARHAQKRLKRDGVDLSLADIQAAIWYYEKRLYQKLSGRKADDIGYEEALATQSSSGAGPEQRSVRFAGATDGGQGREGGVPDTGAVREEVPRGRRGGTKEKAAEVTQQTPPEGGVSVSGMDLSRKRSPVGFYSALAAGISEIKTNSAPASGWKDAIKGLVNKGQVKQDEVEWSGVNDWLDLQQGKVSKEQVSEYLSNNGVQVEEVVLGGDPLNARGADARRAELEEMSDADFRDEVDSTLGIEVDDRKIAQDNRDDLIDAIMRDEARSFDSRANDAAPTKFQQYTLPGGENYREVLLTLPAKRVWMNGDPVTAEDMATEFGRETVERASAFSDAVYRSTHWNQPNVVAHIRMNDRTDADGKRVLFVEEIQSDWGQEGKKKGFAKPATKKLTGVVQKQVSQFGFGDEYEVRWSDGTFSGGYDSRTQAERRLAQGKDDSTPGIPAAPFVTKTEGWVNLALKKIMVMAAEGGYDRVAFINGEQSADRYDLSKRISTIAWRGGDFRAYDLNGNEEIRRTGTSQEDVADLVGKEVAEKLFSQKPEGEGRNALYTLSGEELKVGGEGMEVFYDKIVPIALKKLLPKVGGGQVGTVQIDRGRNPNTYDKIKPFLEWMKSNHPGYKAEEISRMWAMGPENNYLVKEFEESTKRLSQPGFDVTDAMRQKAEEGLPMFSRKRDPHKDAEEKILNEGPTWFQDLPPDVQESLRKVGAVPAKLSLRDRFDALKENLASKMVQGMFDPYAPISKLDDTAYMQARMSTNVTGAFGHIVTDGEVKWDGGWLAPVKGTKGLRDILKQLPEGEIDRFMWWIASNRAEKLSREEREFLFSGRDIAALKRLNMPSMGTKMPTRPVVYAKVLGELNKLNKSVLDVAKQSGLINDQQYKRYAADAFYVPFYRLMEDGDIGGPATAAGLVGQEFSKRLKGGKEQLNDLLANYMNNWDHVIHASAKNMAGRSTLDAAVDAGIATEVKGDPPKGSVKVMVDGKPKHYTVSDPMVFDAISSIYTPALQGMFVKIGSAFKKVFTRTVTASPTFKFYNNLIRDAITSQAISPELSNNPIANTYRGFKLMDKDNPLYNSMLVGGGLFKFSTWDEGDRHEYVKRLVEQGVDQKTILSTPEKIKEFMSGTFAKYMEFGDRAENAQRAAIYDAAIKAGKSQLEASFAARQVIDFSLVGKWAAIRHAAAVLPFFNARLQGMYSLGKLGVAPTIRAAKDGDVSLSDRQRAARFAAVTAAVTAATIALYLANNDDEDFKRREDWDRDSFWWIKINGVAWRIPKPFEIGAFATIVERGLEQIVDSSVEGKVFGKRLWAVVTDQLSINLIPQLVRPAFDVYSNKDGFRETDIESPGMRRLPIEDRVGQNTSYAARAMGAVSKEFADVLETVIGKESADKIQFSPVQIDYLIKGYLGWVGTQALMLSDSAIRAMAGIEAPTPRFQEQIPVRLTLGNTIQELPTSNSRYVGDFYRQSREIGEVMAAIREYERARDFEKARELREKEGDKVELSKLYSRTQRRMSEINKELRRVRDDTEMTADEKRARIDQLEQIREEYAKDAEDARKARR